VTHWQIFVAIILFFTLPELAQEPRNFSAPPPPLAIREVNLFMQSGWSGPNDSIPNEVEGLRLPPDAVIDSSDPSQPQQYVNIVAEGPKKVLWLIRSTEVVKRTFHDTAVTIGIPSQGRIEVYAFASRGGAGSDGLRSGNEVPRGGNEVLVMARTILTVGGAGATGSHTRPESPRSGNEVSPKPAPAVAQPDPRPSSNKLPAGTRFHVSIFYDGLDARVARLVDRGGSLETRLGGMGHILRRYTKGNPEVARLKFDAILREAGVNYPAIVVQTEDGTVRIVDACPPTEGDIVAAIKGLSKGD
jgi:hypothetical protein